MFGFILSFFILNILTRIFFLTDFLDPSVSYAMEENSPSGSKNFLPFEVVNIKGNCEALFQQDPSLKETLCNQPETGTLASSQGKDGSYFMRLCLDKDNAQKISDTFSWAYRSTVKEKAINCHCFEINRQFYLTLQNGLKKI